MARQRLKQAVFMSASVPDPRRHRRFFESADLIAIREAVRALTTVVLSRTTLVFGGHPAINPMVLQVAEAMRRVDDVHIYQSRLFEPVAPEEVAQFRRVHWTENVEGDRDRSLLLMRQEMIGSHRFKAAFFIGGMDGVLEEHELFEHRWPKAKAYPVGSTGAAAQVVLERMRERLSPKDSAALAHDTVYGALFERLLWAPRRAAR